MRFDRYKAFPYPVLRPQSDDYRKSEFQTTADWKISKDSVRLTISYALSCKEILSQIKKGNAEFVSILACRDTYYRAVLADSTSTREADFQSSELRGEVALQPFVVVKKAIATYASPDINPEFGKSAFSLSAGDILAQDEPQIFFVDRELFKPVTSLFHLVAKAEIDEKEWRLGCAQDQVQIQVSPAMKREIDSARNSVNNKIVFLNSLYFAAVMQAIVNLRNTPEDFDGLKWADVMLKQIHNSGLDIETDDAYVIAQKLMQYPLTRLKSAIAKETET